MSNCGKGDELAKTNCAKPGAGNGAKAFGGIMAVVAIIGAVAAMFVPLNDRLKSTEQRQDDIAPKLDTIIMNAAKLAELIKDHDSHMTVGGHPPLSERVKALEANGVTARHMERLIRMLWFKTYGEEMPAVNGGH